MYYSQRREPPLCRKYCFLAKENSGYFKLSSKIKGHTRRNNVYLYLLQKKKKKDPDPPLVTDRSPLVVWHPRWGPQLRSALKPVGTVVLLSQQKQNNVAPERANVTITAKGEIMITSLRSSLRTCLFKFTWKGLELIGTSNSVDRVAG